MKWLSYIFISIVFGEVFTKCYKSNYEELFQHEITPLIYFANALLFLLLLVSIDTTIKGKHLFNSSGILSIVLLFLFQMINLPGSMNRTNNTNIKDEVYELLFHEVGYILFMIETLLALYAISLLAIGVIYVLLLNLLEEFNINLSKKENMKGSLSTLPSEEKVEVDYLSEFDKEISNINQTIQFILEEVANADIEDVHNIMSVIKKLNESIILHKSLSKDSKRETIGKIGEMLKVLNDNLEQLVDKHEAQIKNEIHKNYEFVNGKKQ